MQLQFPGPLGPDHVWELLAAVLTPQPSRDNYGLELRKNIAKNFPFGPNSPVRINYSHPDSKQHLTKQMQLCSDNHLYLGPALIDRGKKCPDWAGVSVSGDFSLHLRHVRFLFAALLRPLLIIRSSANE